MVQSNLAFDIVRKISTLFVSTVTVLVIASPTAQAAPKESVLWSFSSSQPRGIRPAGGVVADASGNLYGTTTGYLEPHNQYGSVFEMAPPGKGRRSWQLHPLQEFTSKTFKELGGNPYSTLVMDPNGALYGTTTEGGAHGYGTVFQITPPTPEHSNGTVSVLANLNNEHAFAGLLRTHNGHLYGVSSNGSETSPTCALQCGTLFEVVPPKDGKPNWNYNPVYVFQGGNDGIAPMGALISDPTGAIYGTTYYGGSGGAGTVFKLTPPAKGEKGWTESVLFAFQNGTDGGLPLARLTLGKKGVLYGTTSSGGNLGCGVSGCGTVFTLSPPQAGQTAWTETIIHSFFQPDGESPDSDVIVDVDGSVFGTTPTDSNRGDGVVFKLTPPARGQGQWQEDILHQFTGDGDGQTPEAGIVKVGKSYFGTTYGGGNFSAGTVFKVAR